MDPAGDRFAELEEKVDRALDVLDDIRVAIAGDKTLGLKGLSRRMELAEDGLEKEATERRESVQRAHKRIDETHQTLAARIDGVERKAAWVAGVIAGAVGGGVGVLARIWQP